MPRLLPTAFCIALVAAGWSPASAAGSPACQAQARRAPADARIAQAVAEAHRQHQRFGGQTVERNGGLFRFGYHEAEWSRPAGAPNATWQQVAVFWRALSEADPPALTTSAGRVARADAARDAAPGAEPSAAEVAVREALLRAAIVDTPWSAAFISYLMQQAGFSRTEFVRSDRHADYVRAALEASAAEAQGQPAAHAFRACDVATTPPRAGDLLCATRASTAGTVRFDALPAAMAGRGADQGFPMHCDLVVRADEGGDAKLETVGGNVLNSVTLTRMTLNARKVLGANYIAGQAAEPTCDPAAASCREHLGRRPWLVLLQFRH